VFQSHFKLPAPQSDRENCVAHNGSIIPVPGRDIFVQAWYQGGISLIDFTDSANPHEIAYFDRGPMNADHLVFGGYWSSYWYRGNIYGTETVRGIDVLALKPSEFLSENEIAAASMADQGGAFNPQQQTRVTWPATPVVALAYIDQLKRSDALSESMVAELYNALDLSAVELQRDGSDRGLAGELEALAEKVTDDGGDASSLRSRTALADTLNGIAAALR